VLGCESMSQIVTSGTLMDSEVPSSSSSNNLADSVDVNLVRQSKILVALFFLFSFGLFHSLIILIPYFNSFERWDLNKGMSSISVDQVVHIGIWL
jgi:hypothetical protein